MMKRLWSDILYRFGQDVVLHREEGDVMVQALVQPVLDQKDQEAPGPLGRERQDRFRYLGPAGQPLDLETVVEWNGREYRVQTARRVGEGVCPHWWAMLYPREEETL